MTRVSVIIASNDRAGSISRAIESVLSQSYHDLELIIVDDGSKDNTAEIVAKYGQGARYFYQPHRGMAAAFNSGIGYASGEYVSFLYPSDVLLRDSIWSAVDVLEKNPDVGFAYGQGLYIDNAYRVVRVKRSTLSQHSDIIDGKDLIREMLFVFRLEVDGLMVRHRCLEETEGFDENLKYGYELPLLVRLAKKYKVAYIAEPLSKRPYQPDVNLGSTTPRQAEQAFLALLEEVFKDQELRDRLGSIMNQAFCANYRRIAGYAYRKDMKMTRLYLRKAFMAHPTYFLLKYGFSDAYLYVKSFLPIRLLLKLSTLKEVLPRRYTKQRKLISKSR